MCSFWAGFLLREYHSSSNFYRYGSAFLLRKSGGQGEQSRRWKVLHKRSECGVSWECKRHSLFPTFASTGSAYVLLHAAVHGGWGCNAVRRKCEMHDGQGNVPIWLCALCLCGLAASGVRTVKGALVVGLTGGIASGKSAVGKLLGKCGAFVIDADEVAREVVRPGTTAYREIVGLFGAAVLTEKTEDGKEPPLDRKKLGALVFADEDARRKLNQITHKEIGLASAQKMREAIMQGAKVIVYEAALLVENKSHLGLHGLIVVDVPEEVQIERAMRRNGMTREEATARLRSQTSREERLKAATWVIENQGTTDELGQKVEALWKELAGPRTEATVL